MNEWMNEWMNELMNEWINERLYLLKGIYNCSFRKTKWGHYLHIQTIMFESLSEIST